MGFIASIVLSILVFLKSITYPFEKDELKEADDQLGILIIVLGLLVLILGAILFYFKGGVK